MGRLLQRAGNGSSIPYLFCPGNHEVSAVQALHKNAACLNIEILHIVQTLDVKHLLMWHVVHVEHGSTNYF